MSSFKIPVSNRDVCELFMNNYDMSNLVCVSQEKKTFYSFETNTNVWKKSTINDVCECIFSVLTTLLKKEKTKCYEMALDEEDKKEKKSLIVRGDKCEELLVKIGSTQFIQNTAKCLLSLQFDDTFENKLNHQTNTIQFKNGSYDLKLGAFRPRVKADYVSTTLDYDFTETVDESKVKYLEQVLRRTCNDSEDVYSSMLKWLGYCLTGEVCESKFMCHIGYTASNGKTTICKILREVLPIYVASMNNKTFDLTYTKVHKEFAKLKDAPIRFVYVEELSKDKLNVSLIKDITGGTNHLENEVMFGTTTSLQVQFKLNLISNHDIVFETDEGMKRRGFMMWYKNKFVPKDEVPKNKPGFYPIDTTLMEKLAQVDYKNAFLHLVMPHSKEYYANGLKLHPSFTSNYTSLCSDNDEMGDFLEARVEITGNPEDRIGKDDFTTAYNLHLKKNLRFIHLLSHLKRNNLEYNKAVRAGGARGCIVGVKWKEEESVAVEFNDDAEIESTATTLEPSGLDEGLEELDLPNNLIKAIDKVASVKVEELPPKLQKKFLKHQEKKKEEMDIEEMSDEDIVSFSF